MHVVSWETNKTRFSKYTSPQIGENQNCPTWVRSPLQCFKHLLKTQTTINTQFKKKKINF